MGLARVHQTLAPPVESSDALARQAHIYRQGRTAVMSTRGEVRVWDVPPASAREVGEQLRRVGFDFGSIGIERSVRGLALTRGSDFAAAAVAHGGVARPGGVAAPLRQSTGTAPIPAELRERLRPTGVDLARVRVHDDAPAHVAAEALDARAFTVGQSIYFGAGEYRPSTEAGARLLAHEAAHTMQQRGTATPPPELLEVSSPEDRAEIEAERFVDAVMRPDGAAAAPSFTPSRRAGRIQRAIRFTHANDTFTRNPVADDPDHEDAPSFTIMSRPGPAFEWNTDITIHGAPGDAFGNFVVGPLQTCRTHWNNGWWGTGANRTHRVWTVSPLPMRDSLTEASIQWDNHVSAPFTADGDVRATMTEDTPGTAPEPWTNPVAGRASNRGWINRGMGFVTHMSARDTTAGTDAAAFHHIAHVYWNYMFSAHWDDREALGSRISVEPDSQVNLGGIIEGASRAFPPMFGGPNLNESFAETTT